MSDPAQMSDEELNMQINNLQHHVHMWGSKNDTGAAGRLQKLLAEQSRRTGVVAEPCRKKVPTQQVRARAVNMAATLVDRAKHALEDAIFVMQQGRLPTAVLEDAIGMVETTLAELEDQGAPVESVRNKRPLDRTDAYGRNMRYVSATEHEILRAASQEAGTLVSVDHKSVARLRLAKAALIVQVGSNGGKHPVPEGYQRWMATPKGRRALETWHYEVDAG